MKCKDQSNQSIKPNGNRACVDKRKILNSNNIIIIIITTTTTTTTIIPSVKQNILSMKQKRDAMGNKNIKRTTRKDS